MRRRCRSQISIRDLFVTSKAVDLFCQVPISRHFTTRAIPGLRNDRHITDALKYRYNIKNPMDLVAHLRFMVRGRRGRPRPHLMANILADFLEDVCDANGIEKKPTSCKTASICIAIMESNLPRGQKVFL